jgi:hypothetical protein
VRLLYIDGRQIFELPQEERTLENPYSWNPVGGVHQSDSVLQNVVVVEDGVNCYEPSNTQ